MSANPLPPIHQPDSSMEELSATLLPVFENAHLEIANGRVDYGMGRLAAALLRLRVKLGPEWRTLCTSNVFAEHPLSACLLEDPFTSRSYQQPRGYPGDAVLLDHIYRIDSPSEETTMLGKAIYEYCLSRPACQSARSRRDYLASSIDSICETRKNPTIVAIACGHARELELSRAFKSGQVGNFVAFDQDAQSLEKVQCLYEGTCVHPQAGSVKDIIKQRIAIPDADFIYAAGLLDYLDDSAAAALVSSLYGRLRKGGSLLVANYLPCLIDVGYMELCMRWSLIFRNERQMATLASTIPSNKLQVFDDPLGNIVYLQADKQ